MAVPKRKTSTSKRNMRRAHKKIKPQTFILDDITGEFRLQHHMSLKNGFYNGKKIIDVDNKTSNETIDDDYDD